MKQLRTPVLTAAVVAVVALAGCGGGSGGGGGGGGAGDPQQAVKDYVHAINSHDWSTACGLISTASRKVIETRSHKSCATALGSELSSGRGAQLAKLLGNAEVGDAHVNGNRGTVNIKVPGIDRSLPLPVVKEGGSWKVSSTSV